MLTTMPRSPHVSVTQQITEDFEAMLPTIQKVAAFGFRRAPRWRREELIQDAIAMAYAAFVNLVNSGRSAIAYPTVLARFAVRQVHDGRQVGAKRNVKDAMSDIARRKKGFTLQQFDTGDVSGAGEEITDDRRANPAEIAMVRVDFQDWLCKLGRLKRQVAVQLAAGDTTTDAARRFQVSCARISQLRQELRKDWDRFQTVPA